LVLIGPEGQVLGASAEATTCGIIRGMTARNAEVRCPEARLLELDVTRCQAESEVLFQLLEEASPKVEPHGWGAAYVDLGDLATYDEEAYSDAWTPDRAPSDAIGVCREIGQAIRRELGRDLQPALGWNSSKFTALAATAPGRWPGDRVQPGHFRIVTAPQEQAFLQPLPVTLLPLAKEVLQRLCFLGLRTLGQYAALPSAAVWQQFGRAGKLAHRCARGEDDRPVIARWQAPHLTAESEFETPLVERARLMAESARLVSPLLADLQGSLKACGKLRLVVRLDDGSAQEKTRTFLQPVAKEERILRALDRLLDGLQRQEQEHGHDPDVDGTTVAVSALAVTLDQIQDTVAEQLNLFSLSTSTTNSTREVQRYLATRFAPPAGSEGSSFESPRLRRAVISRPGAPLPEWRVDWLDEPILKQSAGLDLGSTSRGKVEGSTL
jgi:nucleotidyltransferase/DNA polymerase involved in DNA repair